MKRISLLAAMVFLAIFVVACSKDDKTDNAAVQAPARNVAVQEKNELLCRV